MFVVIIIIFFFMISLLFPVLSYSNPLHFSILSFFICPQSFPFEGRIEFQTGSKDESDETVLSHEELTLSLLFVSWSTPLTGFDDDNNLWDNKKRVRQYVHDPPAKLYLYLCIYMYMYMVILLSCLSSIINKFMETESCFTWGSKECLKQHHFTLLSLSHLGFLKQDKCLSHHHIHLFSLFFLERNYPQNVNSLPYFTCQTSNHRCVILTHSLSHPHSVSQSHTNKLTFMSRLCSHRMSHFLWNHFQEYL